MRRCLALLVALAAAGCTSNHTLATCKGPLEKVCPEDR